MGRPSQGLNSNTEEVAASSRKAAAAEVRKAAAAEEEEGVSEPLPLFSKNVHRRCQEKSEVHGQ
jgi:hypothetical protein